MIATLTSRERRHPRIFPLPLLMSPPACTTVNNGILVKAPTFAVDGTIARWESCLRRRRLQRARLRWLFGRRRMPYSVYFSPESKILSAPSGLAEEYALHSARLWHAPLHSARLWHAHRGVPLPLRRPRPPPRILVCIEILTAAIGDGRTKKIFSTCIESGGGGKGAREKERESGEERERERAQTK